MIPIPSMFSVEALLAGLAFAFVLVAGVAVIAALYSLLSR